MKIKILLFSFLLVTIFSISEPALAYPKFLYYPFSEVDNIDLQQGWFYHPNVGGGEHKGIDYIKGEIDNSSTWESFDIKASADGQAYYCYDCSTSWGNYVVTKFTISGTDYYNVSAHLESSPLPPQTWVPISAGETIGIAGHTGTTFPEDATHLHYEFSQDNYGQGYKVDPYDIYEHREYYPEHGGNCGPDYAWTECPPNYTDNIIYVGGHISEDTTWEYGNIYVVDSVTVDVGITLTIEPGVIVKFGQYYPDASLRVLGNLNAPGTDDRKIHFTSYEDDTVGGDTNGDGSGSLPSVGDYRGIFVDSGSAYIENAVLRYSGAQYWFYELGGIHNEDGNLMIEDSTFSLNEAGVSAYTNSNSSVTTITDSNFFDNNFYDGTFKGSNINFISQRNVTSGIGRKGFFIRGALGENQVWYPGIPYLASGAYVPPGKILTINPGVIVKFQNVDPYFGHMEIRGTLNALGASTDKIYFTSYKDDSVGGDSNGDGNNSKPYPKDYDSIRIQDKGMVNIENAVIRYGGFFGDGVLNNNGGNLYIYSSLITQNGDNGIIMESSGSVANISNSSIKNHTNYGITNYYNGSVTAENNWWGKASGPYHSTQNPDGQGNAVSNGVDFIPWLTKDPFKPIIPITPNP